MQAIVGIHINIYKKNRLVSFYNSVKMYKKYLVSKVAGKRSK